MYIDCKVTTWERIQVPEEEEQKILDGLIEGTLKNGDDIFNNLEVGNVEFIEGVPSQPLSVEDNDGYATIEVYDDENNDIWDNSEL